MHQLTCIGDLVVVDENVNQYSHIDIMGGNLLKSVEQMFRDQQDPFVSQQDNAPCTNPWRCRHGSKTMIDT